MALDWLFYIIYVLWILWVEISKDATEFNTGFPAEPGKPGDLNFICPGPEIAWNLSQNVRKPGQNKTISKKHGWNLEC